MSQHDTYILRIWSNRALAGTQWVASVDSITEGEHMRFADPQELLAHLEGLVLGDGAGDGESGPVAGETTVS